MNGGSEGCVSGLLDGSKAMTTRKVADISQVPPRSPCCQAQTVPIARRCLPPHPPGRHHQMVQGQIRCHRKVNIFEAKKQKSSLGGLGLVVCWVFSFFSTIFFFFPFPCPYRGTPICTLNKTGNIWYEIQSMSHLLALFGTQKEISSSRSIGGSPFGVFFKRSSERVHQFSARAVHCSPWLHHGFGFHVDENLSSRYMGKVEIYFRGLGELMVHTQSISET